MEPKPMHASLARAFHKEHNLKHPGLVDLITTIQNKTKQTTFLPSQIDPATTKKFPHCPLACSYTVHKLKGTKCQLPKGKKLS
jgi:hypothetical protein